MRTIWENALKQAKTEEHMQSWALAGARWSGDRENVYNFRNARDRARLAMHWIRARLTRQ